MTKTSLITKSSTKRVGASALLEVKARREWSNVDLGDAMDCSEGTVRLRIDGDDVAKQMTMHEARRITQADGPAVLNALLSDIGYCLSPIADLLPDVNPMGVAATAARTASDLITLAVDGIDPDEAAVLLPLAVTLTADLTDLKAHLRAIIKKGKH